MDHLHRLATLHQRVHSVLRGVNHLSTHRGGRIGAPNLELGRHHRRPEAIQYAQWAGMPYTCTASSHAAPMSRGFVRIVKVVFFCALAAAVLLDLTLHLAHAGAHLPTSWTAEEAVKTPCVLVDGVLDVETGNVMYNTPKPTGAHLGNQCHGARERQRWLKVAATTARAH
jgi:hypothetical protein